MPKNRPLSSNKCTHNKFIEPNEYRQNWKSIQRNTFSDLNSHKKFFKNIPDLKPCDLYSSDNNIRLK